MKKSNILAYAFCLLQVIGLKAQHIEKPSQGTFKSNFAIVVDDSTYAQAKEEIALYKRSLEQKGLGTYIVSHHWQSPQQIRDILKKLYGQKIRLEGAVLVGHIPVAMIRDAQHLTSTFKMDQRLNWQRSSVPSDRYYDDFDLQFNFIKQDSIKKEYFYYSLDASSPQHIRMDIYTARIKPPLGSDKDFYGAIKRYLKKAAYQAGQNEVLDRLTVYTGHGYHSESLNAWAGEQVALKEQLPQLFRVGGSAKFLNFRMETFMRFPYLNEIQDPALDMAIYHGHGSADAQLMNGYPLASNPQPSIENIRRYLRSKIQGVNGKNGDVAATKQRYQEWLDVPLSWMEDALTDSVLQADSIFNAQTDLSIADLNKVSPNARMVILDACDNGSYHLDDYIAAYYPFANGKTILSMASSVGVIQDQWADELLGILAQGVRVGNWFKEVAYLETHLFGDPTFSFAGSYKPELNTALIYSEKYAKLWGKLLEAPEADVQALALAKLFGLEGKGISSLLKQRYFGSDYAVVRLEALKLLNKLGNDDYKEVLKTAINDPYELTRRLAVPMMGETGDDSYITYLVESAINNRDSERVLSRTNNVLPFMNSDKVLAEIERQIGDDSYLTDAVSVKKNLKNKQLATKQKIANDYEKIGDKEKADKERLFNVRTLRAYRYHEAIPHIIALIKNDQENTVLRVQALEALSWFGQSYKKKEIINLCQELLNSPYPTLSKQAQKTLSILNVSLSY